MCGPTHPSTALELRPPSSVKNSEYRDGDGTASQTVAPVASILESTVIQTSYLPSLRLESHTWMSNGTID